MCPDSIKVNYFSGGVGLYLLRYYFSNQKAVLTYERHPNMLLAKDRHRWVWGLWFPKPEDQVQERTPARLHQTLGFHEVPFSSRDPRSFLLSAEAERKVFWSCSYCRGACSLTLRNAKDPQSALALSTCNTYFIGEFGTSF